MLLNFIDKEKILKQQKTINHHSYSLAGFSWGLLSVVGWATDVGEDTSFGNGGVVQELVEFFVVSDGEKDVSGDDSGLLVVLSGVTGEFQNFSSQVFEDGGEIDGGSSTDSFSVVGMSKESSDSSDWELKASSWWLGDCLWWGCFSFSWFSTFSGHLIDCLRVNNYKKSKNGWDKKWNFIRESFLEPIKLIFENATF